MSKSSVFSCVAAAIMMVFVAAAFAQPEPPCDPCVTFCSYTQGGWGAPCNGGNVGCIRNECFEAIYPNGLFIGRNYPNGCCWLRFTSSQAIEDFLPQGQTPQALTQNATDPGIGNITVFAGQVLALKLNVDYGDYGCGNMVPIGDMIVADGPFAGWTIDALLAAAMEALGGGALPPGVTIPMLNAWADSVNQNFDNCTDNDGHIVIPPQAQSIVIRPRDDVDPVGDDLPLSACLTFTSQCSDYCVMWWCPYCGPNDYGIFTWAAGCNYPECGSDFCVAGIGELEFGDQVLIEPDPAGGCWWSVPIHATEPGCYCLTLEFQLPVELVGFDAVEGDAQVRLEWSTASEINNDRFEVQRALDGVSWMTIGRVDGRGTYTGPSSYTFVDNNVTNGTTYNYRLMTVDMNGNITQAGHTESATPSKTAGLPQEFALYQNYPNPFNPSTSIRFDIAEAGHVTLAVYDLNGRIVATLVNGELAAKSYTVSFDASGLSTGTYFYRLEAGNFTAMHKMLVIK